MPDDLKLRCAVAAGAVDETIALVSACLATGEPVGAVGDTIRSIRKDLHAISVSVLSDESDHEALECLKEFPTNTKQADTVAANPPARAEPGHSMAAAMLRLARVVCQRAHRDLIAVSGVQAAILEFMGVLPHLLDTLANQLDAEEERSLPVGMCFHAE